mgnify:CR=1 FL=1
MGDFEHMDQNAEIVRNDEIIFTDMDRDMVMMSVEKGEYYGVNRVGRKIFEMLERPMTVSEICQALCVTFNVSEEQCLKDMAPFLKQMADKGIIRVLER